MSLATARSLWAARARAYRPRAARLVPLGPDELKLLGAQPPPKPEPRRGLSIEEMAAQILRVVAHSFEQDAAAAGRRRGDAARDDQRLVTEFQRGRAETFLACADELKRAARLLDSTAPRGGGAGQ